MSPRITSTHAFAIALAAVAMVLKLLFSPGLMPAVNAQGEATLVICTGQGSKVIADPYGHEEERQPSCAFEGQAPVMPVEGPQPMQLAVVDYPVPPLAAYAAPSPGRGLTAPPPPSTGPPSARA